MPNVKELSKAITAFLAAPSLPLPEDLQSTIDVFIQKHKTHDDQCAETLREELHSLYRKHVATPDYVARMPPFFAIVSMLSGNLRSEERVREWWDIGRAFITNVLKDPLLVVESTSWMQQYLALGNGLADGESGDESSPDTVIGINPLLDKLVDIWAADYHLGFVAGSQDYSEKALRDAMLQYGKKNPKRFFVCVDRFLVRKETRKAALSLLIELVQAQPPRLHLIMQTPLFANLLRCLQHDASTSVVSSALTLLLMILPNMPSSLAPHLSVLFNIYARLLFWSRDRADLGDGGDMADAPSWTAPSGWDVHPPSPDDGQHIPRLVNYFTVLYGLFPINLMEYIRKPQRYLRHFDASRSDDVEVEATEIRQKSEPFRQCHIIHPNFYTTTIESEKTDFGRWQKSEPADITAECMALCLVTESGGENFGRSVDLEHDVAASFDGLEALGRDDRTAALLSGSMPADGWRRLSASPALSHVSAQLQTPLAPEHQIASWPTSARESTQASAVPSPFLLAQPGSPSSHARLQDMIHHNRAIKLSLNQSLPNDSIPSLSLSQIESTATDTDKQTVGVAAQSDPHQHVAHLQRQLTLLQNDLRFERYLRQQHVAHIGTLRRKQLSEMATEAEMQKLMLSNRNMKHRIEEAKKGEMQARRESEKSRAMSKKWESDMYSKLRAAKEEVKRSNTEGDSLRRELEQSKDECEKLKQMVCMAEARELTSRQHWETAQADIAKVQQLKEEVERLNAAGQATGPKPDDDLSTTPTVGSTALSVHPQVEGLRIQLAAREHDMQQMRASFEEQIAQLKAQSLQPVGDDQRRPKAESDVADVRFVFENALAASRAKQAELQGQYDSLARKHTALQSELLEMRAGGASIRINSPAISEYESPFASPISPASVRGPSRSRVFSDQETPDGASFNVTPPLDPRSAANSPTLSGVGGPLQVATSWALDGGVPLTGEGRYSSRSPSQHSSGLHLSRGRKEGKEKKSSGLRGLSRLGGGGGSSSTS